MAKITAQNKDGIKRTFDINVWNKLPVKSKDGTRYGWKQVAEAPEEVTNLAKQQVQKAAEIKTPDIEPAAKNPVVTLPEEKKQLTTRELIKSIGKAKNEKELSSLIAGDSRVTVIKAAEHRKSQFK